MKTVDRHRQMLERAALLKNEGDLILARIGQEVVAAHGRDRGEGYLRAKDDGLGLHSNTARSILDKGEALAEIPDEEVWRAVGWSGVRGLLSLGKRARKGAIREALTEAKGTELATGRVHVIVTKRGGVMPNGRGKAKPTTSPKPLAPRGHHMDDTTTPTIRGYEKLCDEIRKLAEGDLPILKSLLSPVALRTIGLKGRKAVAS